MGHIEVFVPLQDMYSNASSRAISGGLAVGVPGELLGLYTAWQMFGRLPWAALVQPAVDYAHGFSVGRWLASAILVGTACSPWD